MFIQSISSKSNYPALSPNSRVEFGKTNYDRNSSDKYISSKNNTSKWIKNNWGKLLVGAAAISAAVVGTVTAVKNHKFKRELKEIYGKVWEDVFQNSEITKKMNMQKPELVFEPLEKSTNAAYSFELHKCFVDISKYRKNRFFVSNDKGDSIASGMKLLHSAEDIEKMRQEGKLKGFIVKELTKAEQKLFYTNTIAHELRHSAQLHTLLHTEGVGKEEVLKLLKEQGVSEEACKRIANYDPGNYMKENIGLISPIELEDGTKIAFSSKDHFWKGFKAYSKKVKEYVANPLEIDANAYARDFITRNPKYSENCSKDVVALLQKQDSFHVNAGLMLLKKQGYEGVTPVKKS